MGYVTQKRKPYGLPYGKSYMNGSQFSPFFEEYTGTGSFEPYQETYSWRTGRLDPSSSENAEEAALLASQDPGQIFAAMANEYANAKQSPYDTGHPFETQTRKVICTPELDTTWSYLGNTYRYVGHVRTVPSTLTPGGFGTVPSFDSNYYGVNAIQRTIPTNPLLDLSVALAELKREGFPKPGSALYKLLSAKGTVLQIGDVFKTAADENLAVQFGLMPVLKDLSALKSAITKAEVLWTQHVQDSGKLIRRSFSYPQSIDSDVLNSGTSNASIQMFSGIATGVQNRAFVGDTRGGKHYLDTVITRKIDFSAGYTYYLPEGRTFLETIARIDELSNMLIGHRVNASTGWNLSPWSWLVDWNINIGANIANAESLSRDGLVISYAYLMCKTHKMLRSVVHAPPTKDGRNRGPYTTIYDTVSKKRVKASPFGFGLNPSSFTARQWSILGSLGYTKGSGVLRTQ